MRSIHWTLLSIALLAACLAAPSLAGATAAPAAVPAIQTAAPAQAGAPSAAVDSGFLAQVLSGGVACPAASSPLPTPQIQCFRCPVGLVSCGLPSCRCCRVATASCCQ